jgi:hypothetical protein
VIFFLAVEGGDAGSSHVEKMMGGLRTHFCGERGLPPPQIIQMAGTSIF